MDEIPQNNKIFPFVWPWCGDHGRPLLLRSLIKRKIFSIVYLVFVWSIVGVLGFASTWYCEGSWQLKLQCDFAYWAKNLAENPLIFIRNIFTTMFLHNGIDHILFVSILGFLVIIQSFESIFGSRITALVFLSSYLTVGVFFGVFYTFGMELFPDSDFIQVAYSRNWMGGSIGMFQVYGALAVKSRKSWVMLMIPVIFEMYNYFLNGIDLNISLMHLSSVGVGYIIGRSLVK